MRRNRPQTRAWPVRRGKVAIAGIDALSTGRPATPIPKDVAFWLFRKPRPAGEVRRGGNGGGRTGALLDYFAVAGTAPA